MRGAWLVVVGVGVVVAGCLKDEGKVSDSGITAGPHGIEACVVDYYGDPMSPASVFVTEDIGQPEIEFSVDATGCVFVERDPGTVWRVQARTPAEDCFSDWISVEIPGGEPQEITLDASYLCIG